MDVQSGVEFGEDGEGRVRVARRFEESRCDTLAMEGGMEAPDLDRGTGWVDESHGPVG